MNLMFFFSHQQFVLANMLEIELVCDNDRRLALDFNYIYIIIVFMLQALIKGNEITNPVLQLIVSISYHYCHIILYGVFYNSKNNIYFNKGRRYFEEKKDQHK